MEARIRQLQATLKTAEVVELSEGAGDGCYRDRRRDPLRGDDETERFFVGSIEERQEGVDVIPPAPPSGRP